ncbi:hypothetical protein ACOSP7_021710 [Xanthoceras sorbifolium]
MSKNGVWKLELEDSELPPPHLLAEEEEEEEEEHHHRETCLLKNNEGNGDDNDKIGGANLGGNPRINKGRSSTTVIERMLKWPTCMKMMVEAALIILLMMRKRLVKPFVSE